MDDLFGDLPPPKTPNENPGEKYNNEDLKLKTVVKKRSAENQSDLMIKRKKEDTRGCRFKLSGHVASRKGERDDMQDAHVVIDDCTSLFADHKTIHRAAFYAVFDGHAGDKASTFAAQYLLKNIVNKLPTDLYSTMDKDVKRSLTDAFKATDEAFLQEASQASPPWKDGSTATAVLILNDTIYSANVGDSKAFLVRSKVDKSPSLISLSKDHSPLEYDERMRIQKAGGNVRDGRVLGVLEVSRSFGDSRFKKYGVTSLPDITKCTLSERDRYLIVACDGLWKGFDPPDAVAYVEKENHTGMDTISTSIANEAIRRGCADNVTVILVSITTPST